MRIRGEFFDVNVNITTNRGNIDIVVSVKISKKAVVRNRIRRQVREILRSYNKTKSFGGLNLKIIAQPKIVGIRFSDINNDLVSILSKIR